MTNLENLDSRIVAYREEVLEAKKAHERWKAQMIFEEAYSLVQSPLVTDGETLRHHMSLLRHHPSFTEIPPKKFLSEVIDDRLESLRRISLERENLSETRLHRVTTRLAAILLRDAFHLEEAAQNPQS